MKSDKARAAGLSDRCRKRIDKAFRVVAKMKATIVFFFCSLKLAVGEMGLEPEIEALFLERWVPGFYLKQVADKTKDKEQKKTAGSPVRLAVEFSYRSLRTDGEARR